MTRPATPTPVEFDPEYIALLTDMFERQITFNAVLGLKIISIQPDAVEARIGMKPELVGHYQHGRVHGGVISAALDAIAGIAVLAAVGARHMDEAPAKRLERFAKLGTIDLRVDYLRPAVGESFALKAEVMRLGSRVGSTRMEFRGADGKLMATGAGAYIMS